MSMIIRCQDRNFKYIDAALFEQKDCFQAYITVNLEAIPLYRLGENCSVSFKITGMMVIKSALKEGKLWPDYATVSKPKQLS